jgi:hypothetical protein
MIIFELDGILADYEHRLHFVHPSYRNDCCFHDLATLTQSEGWYYKDEFLMSEPPKAKKFIPDWKAFDEACDKDIVIPATRKIFLHLLTCGFEIEIWSGRCESVREKTIDWIKKEIFQCAPPYDGRFLKMRPIGDNTPDDQLKERWLDEASICVNEMSGRIRQCNPIDFVFDSDQKSIQMWRRKGIFVFDCNQTGDEF